MIKRIQPGRRICQAVVANGTVTTSGITGTGTDAEAQTRDILAQVDALLAEAGTNKSNLISATVWLRDVADFDAMNRAWDAWVDPANVPVRATIEARLFTPDLQVEIQISAAV
ncbi:RidA family protein [Shinella zoogloeoides]|uniref:RidA family protein n=1 Tax=Shinella zoogloeoides TaxID=352475 RepID=UPI00299EAD79|nr:RidA family protein [Shinella zoogloeoides]WPE24337.1 Putative aminoacrylate peracid reductase RutC [Shinella zoogloeoides]